METQKLHFIMSVIRTLLNDDTPCYTISHKVVLEQIG